MSIFGSIFGPILITLIKSQILLLHLLLLFLDNSILIACLNGNATSLNGNATMEFAVTHQLFCTNHSSRIRLVGGWEC